MSMNAQDVSQCRGQWYREGRTEDGTVEILNPTRKRVYGLSTDLGERFDAKVDCGCYNIIMKAALVFRAKTERAKLQYRDKIEEIISGATPDTLTTKKKRKLEANP